MDIKNKVCLITGATSGIGKHAAFELAAKGAILVLPVRDVSKGESLLGELKAKVPGVQAEIMYCNLASLASVRAFAEEFKQKYQQLHVLINNAGMWQRVRKESEDGIELNLAVNHLAPFLLTNLLLETMINSSPARIINVSSDAHRRSTIDFSDIESSTKYSPLRAYSQSKLANILFTKKLSQMLKGTGVTANCMHPGVVRTAFFDPLPAPILWCIKPFMVSARQGAQTIIYLATSQEVENAGGEYFVKCKPRNPSKDALRKDFADWLWEVSSNYVGY